MFHRVICIIVIASSCLATISPPGWAENGVTSSEIVLGQTCVLSGPTQALGNDMRAGLLAAFGRVNDAGGIAGRKIRLISLDDGYEPDRTIRNARFLIDREKVFLLIGAVGSPTSKAILPVIEKTGVPYVGPLTGAEFLRTPYHRYVVNVRGSYHREMEELVRYLVDKKKLRSIACMYQNDEYGQSGLNGLRIALRKRSLELAAAGSYERNSVAVKSALLKIRQVRPEAVVMVGLYRPCAEFVRRAHSIGMSDTIFCTISGVGHNRFIEEAGAFGEGCIISEIVNFPWDSSVPLVSKYHFDMNSYQPESSIGFHSLEGYIVGTLFAAVAGRIEGELTRESFLDTVSDIGTFNLDGIVLEFGPDDNQGMDQVFLMKIVNGKTVPI